MYSAGIFAAWKCIVGFVSFVPCQHLSRGDRDLIKTVIFIIYYVAYIIIMYVFLT